MLSKDLQRIIDLVRKEPSLSSSEIHLKLKTKVEQLTTKRNLTKLVNRNLLARTGTGKATRYVINPAYKLFAPINIKDYYKQEIDQRAIQSSFDLALINGLLATVDLFNEEETNTLNSVHEKYLGNISGLSETLYAKEQERLAIDLSWKSSQIEGNTYSLLETEQLLKEHKEAKGKKKEEATMLLNHKEAINYVIDQPKDIEPLKNSKIEILHRILTKDLGVSPNIRTRLVGITGTNYKPLDNEYQIIDALNDMCDLVNDKSNIFEKAFLLLLLISYIQPFEDGNKRTARIVSNAILIGNDHCPLSYRTVDPTDYKKALLMFYEQNNIQAFKNIFIEQYDFAVNTYFQ